MSAEKWSDVTIDGKPWLMASRPATSGGFEHLFRTDLDCDRSPGFPELDAIVDIGDRQFVVTGLFRWSYEHATSMFTAKEYFPVRVVTEAVPIQRERVAKAALRMAEAIENDTNPTMLERATLEQFRWELEHE